MKNFDLTSMGVHEMDTLEMQETDGGVILFLVMLAVVFCTSSCINNGPVNIQVGSGNTNEPANGGTMTADSTSVNLHLR